MSTLSAPLAVLAHQGGWDEMLLVGGPILVIGGLLVVANRRAKKLGVEQSEGRAPGGSDKP